MPVADIPDDQRRDGVGEGGRLVKAREVVDDRRVGAGKFVRMARGEWENAAGFFLSMKVASMHLRETKGNAGTMAGSDVWRMTLAR